MDLNKFLSLFKSRSWFNDFLLVLSLIVPGFWAIYLTEPELVQDIGDVKLVILSLTYSLPPFYFTNVAVETAFGKEIDLLFKEHESLKGRSLLLLGKIKQSQDLENLPKMESIVSELDEMGNSDTYRYHLVSFFVLTMLFCTTVRYIALGKSGETFGFNAFLFDFYVNIITSGILLILATKTFELLKRRRGAIISFFTLVLLLLSIFLH